MSQRPRASFLAAGVVAAAALLAACSDEAATASTGALVPLAGAYAYSAATRTDVVMSGVMIVTYAGADSLSGEILAADPQGKPYLEGHFLAIRQADGAYIFEAPKSSMEPTSSRYVHRLRRTLDGLTCELRDTRGGETVTKVCALGAPNF